MSVFSARELALHAARIALDKGGEQLRVLFFPPASGMPFDYCLLVNGRSDRQVNAIVDEIHQFAKRHGLTPLPVEGGSGWMLIDLLNVVVHGFSEEKRELYQLDQLWRIAGEVDYEKELKGLADPDAAKSLNAH